MRKNTETKIDDENRTRKLLNGKAGRCKESRREKVKS